MIVSNLNGAAGFFSMLFFTFNHYIYAKKNRFNFKIRSDEWLFLCKSGWVDYFDSIDVDDQSENSCTIIEKGHDQVLEKYALIEYVDYLGSFYKLNKFVVQEIIEKKQEIDLHEFYYAIFVRRGDKLVSESKYHHGSEYLKKLIEKNKIDFKCQVFVQTDDYKVILEMEDYLKNKQLENITLKTICPKTSHGAVIFNYFANQMKFNNVRSDNADYIANNQANLLHTCTVENMNLSEKREHTMRMLTGIEIVKAAAQIVTDYESNVSRFIKICCPEKTCSINEVEDAELDWEKKICPAYSF